jgi:hypothetical protein
LSSFYILNISCPHSSKFVLHDIIQYEMYASSRVLTELYESAGLVAIWCISMRFFEWFRAALEACEASWLPYNVYDAIARTISRVCHCLKQARMENITTMSSANLEELRKGHFYNLLYLIPYSGKCFDKYPSHNMFTFNSRL